MRKRSVISVIVIVVMVGILGYAGLGLWQLRQIEAAHIVGLCEARKYTYRETEFPILRRELACAMRLIEGDDLFTPFIARFEGKDDEILVKDLFQDIAVWYFACKQPLWNFVEQADMTPCSNAYHDAMSWALATNNQSLSDLRRTRPYKCSPFHVALDQRDRRLFDELVAAGLNPATRPENACVIFNQLNGLPQKDNRSPAELASQLLEGQPDAI